MTTPQQDVDLVALAERDPRSARIFAEAQQRRVDAEEQRRTAAAESERRIQERAARVRQKAEAAAAKQAAKQARKATRRAAWRARLGWAIEQVEYARGNPGAVWSMVVYGLAVGTAVAGQTSVVTSHLGWSTAAGVGVAVFVEGLALSMALTAHELRLRGERALAPRTLTWVAALGAAAVNAYAHKDNLLAAALLAASSLAGIVVWEIRTGARHRDQLRDLELIASPRPRLGLAYWLRYPSTAWWAHSASIASPSVQTRDQALTAGARMREARGQAAARRELMRRTRRAIRRATRKGDAGAALAGLVRLADLTRQPFPMAPALTGGPRIATPDLVSASREPVQRSSVAVRSTRRSVRPESQRALAARSGSRRETRSTVVAVRSGDLVDLLPVARKVREQLAAQGRPLSRRSLAEGLRAAGRTVGNERALQLIEALSRESSDTATMRGGVRDATA